MLVPSTWSAGLTTRTDFALLDVHAGIDHSPVGAELQVSLLPRSDSVFKIDRQAINTPAGKAKVQAIFEALPPIP